MEKDRAGYKEKKAQTINILLALKLRSTKFSVLLLIHDQLCLSQWIFWPLDGSRAPQR